MLRADADGQRVARGTVIHPAPEVADLAARVLAEFDKKGENDA